MPLFRGSSLRDRLLGGGNLNGICTWQPGPALSWGNLIDYGVDLKPDPRRVDGAFDTSRFNTVPAQQPAWKLFNAFNRPQYNPPNRNAVNRDFSLITGQDNLSRTVQMPLRMIWQAAARPRSWPLFTRQGS